jgi:hypothetical protein
MVLMGLKFKLFANLTCSPCFGKGRMPSKWILHAGAESAWVDLGSKASPFCAHKLCCILLLSDLFVFTDCVAFCWCQIYLCSHIELHFVVADLFVLTDCITFCCHISLQSHSYPCYEALWMWWLCELRLSRF